MTQDVLSLVAAAVDTVTDQTQASKGGGEGYTPPAAGVCPVRLVAYIETGTHERSVGAGKPKVQKPQVLLTFELLGPKHPPKEIDGVKYPVLLSEDFNASNGYGPLNEKAGLYKLFKRMNHDGSAKHISQLLGKPFLATVVHETRGEGEAKKTYAALRDENGSTVRPPMVEAIDENTGEASTKHVKVPEATAPLRLFIWSAAPDIIGKMWDTLFIDGSYPERKNDKGEVTAAARSKNTLQEKIKAALNFKDSPIFQYLQTGGKVLELGAQAEKPKAAPAESDDPLAGVA